MRKSEIERKTTETAISVAVNLDGGGVYDIQTGVGFLDHMLEQLAQHSAINISVRAVGDTHIDHHHVTEDTGIALGQAVSKALGERKGIQRFSSHYIAMDEALTRAVIDVSGRSFLVWKVKFSSPRIGDFDTELVREWFQAFAMNVGITLHVENLYGENNHHIAESCFKALARALGKAIAIDPSHKDKIPSTKGSLSG